MNDDMLSVVCARKDGVIPAHAACAWARPTEDERGISGMRGRRRECMGVFCGATKKRKYRAERAAHEEATGEERTKDGQTGEERAKSDRGRVERRSTAARCGIASGARDSQREDDESGVAYERRERREGERQERREEEGRADERAV